MQVGEQVDLLVADGGDGDDLRPLEAELVASWSIAMSCSASVLGVDEVGLGDDRRSSGSS